MFRNYCVQCYCGTAATCHLTASYYSRVTSAPPVAEFSPKFWLDISFNTWLNFLNQIIFVMVTDVIQSFDLIRLADQLIVANQLSLNNSFFICSLTFINYFILFNCYHLHYHSIIFIFSPFCICHVPLNFTFLLENRSPVITPCQKPFTKSYHMATFPLDSAQVGVHCGLLHRRCSIAPTSAAYSSLALTLK